MPWAKTTKAVRRSSRRSKSVWQALIEAIEATEAHLSGLGFDPSTLIGSTGFSRIKGLKDAVEAAYTSDEAKRRFEVLARQVFTRFKSLTTEPSAFAYAKRHDNIEAVYKKLAERRDTADVTELLKELHRIVNEAIRTQAPGDDQAGGLTLTSARSIWKTSGRIREKCPAQGDSTSRHPRDCGAETSQRCSLVTRRVWITSRSMRRSSQTTIAEKERVPLRRLSGG